MTNLLQFMCESYIVLSRKLTQLKITFLQKLWAIFHCQGIEIYNVRGETHLASRNMRTTLFLYQRLYLPNVGVKI